MSFDADALYGLLPSEHRTRDAAQGQPLKQLLSVIAEQIAIVEEDIAQLYDNQFIETCADWVVPYIGDLIGHDQLYGLTSQIRSPRAEVANTIGLRRRKGTAGMLAQLARDVTGWDAHAVELFQRVATTQFMNHLRPKSLGTVALRPAAALEHLNGPFEHAAHTVEVRRIATGRGRYNVSNIGIFLWRLRSYSLHGAPAFKLDDRRYLFNPLGANMQLFRRGEQIGSSTTPSPQSGKVAMPVGRRIANAQPGLFYGADASFAIAGVTLDQLMICDLSDTTGGAWTHMPPAGKVTVDPVLGRIAFGTSPAAAPAVTHHYGFAADLGGGEYDRLDTLDVDRQPVVRVPAQAAVLQTALNSVRNGGAVEIGDNGRYAATPAIQVAANATIELRAANKTRPLIALGGDLSISGEDGAEVSLNGLLITGGRIRVTESAAHKRLRRLRLRHCTLVPGLGLTSGGAPQQPTAPSLVVETAGTVVEIDHCIIGGLRVAADAQVTINNSIVDATAENNVAYAAIDGTAGGAPLQVINSTIIGKVHSRSLVLASNSLFLAQLAAGDGWQAPVLSDRRQEGCARFSWLPPGSRTPRRYHCQPATDADAGRLRPLFTSLRYGDPGYCQLSRRSATEIRQGADDGSEIGVFHDLFQPQRETNLRLRLKEYAAFDLEAGFVFVT
jgi:hypothetical protein